MNLYYLRSEILRPTVKFVSIVFLLLCTCWDFFCTHIYLGLGRFRVLIFKFFQGILKDARNYDSWFLDDMDMKDELVQEIKLKCVPFVVLHVLEAILCGYTFIVMLLTGSAYEYAECKFFFFPHKKSFIQHWICLGMKWRKWHHGRSRSEIWCKIGLQGL